MLDFCDPQKQHPIGGIISSNETRLSQTITKFSNTFQTQLGFPDGHTFFYDFGTTIISELLKQPDCIGIRIYPGLDENDRLTMSVIGITLGSINTTNTLDSNEKQLMKVEALQTGEIDENIICCCPRNGK
ncbi:hypothetical protein VB796_12715 [Arcicella sp. LKC2W]|uniref:hypothetical protein n=1 Tax=Arcicella sp. LKC2W TaxID=2984198 RepID=UPI002B207641|nr:hypothetical protein [Arcicella sp. LKC2W]MEA5459909.1 hypothetical protein [Arcicella sp. LKC2W]